MPDPAPLGGVFIPVVLANGEGRSRCPVVDGNPFGVIPMNHIIAPASIPDGLELQEIPDKVAADGLVGVVKVSESVIAVCGPAVQRIVLRAFFLCTPLFYRRLKDF